MIKLKLKLEKHLCYILRNHLYVANVKIDGYMINHIQFELNKEDLKNELLLNSLIVLLYEK